jgi:hypothetical protein
MAKFSPNLVTLGNALFGGRARWQNAIQVDIGLQTKDLPRVTRRACEKVAQNLAQYIFSKLINNF